MKHSVSSKFNMEILTIRLQKNEQVVQNEVLWINSQQLTGFVPVETEEKGNTYALNYNVTGFIPLKKYTRNKIQRNDFALFLESIVMAFEPLQSKGLTYGKVLLDDKSIYINPVTKKGQFIYVPVDTYDNGVYIEKFLSGLLEYFKFDKSENLQYLQELKNILNDVTGVTWESLKQYVDHLKSLEMQKFQHGRAAMAGGRPPMQSNMGGVNNRSPMQPNMGGVNNPPVMQPNMPGVGRQTPQASSERAHVFCVACGFKNLSNARFCVKCGKPIEHKTEPQAAPTTVQPIHGQAVQPIQQQMPQQAVSMPKAPVTPNPPVFAPQWDDDEDSATTVLGNFDDESEEATTVLSSTRVPVVIYPYLIRESTQERIQADKEVFIIGKGKASDYVITGNNAVSRKHVSIITRDNHYYVVDNVSTNKTFINDEQLQPEQEYEVFSGTKIRMADEDFTLYVDGQ